MRSDGGVSFKLDARDCGPEPIYGAAYQLMDRAFVVIAGDPGQSMEVVLRPKSAADADSLRRDFEDELAAQKFRWAVARNGLPIREYIIENAAALAKEFIEREAAACAPSAPEQLTADQKSEIARLISEVEGEIAQMNAKAEPAERKTAGLSWEAARKTDDGRSPA